MSTTVANYQVATSVGPRFIVAGLMLGVLAAWMKVNHESAPAVPIVAVGVAAGFSLLWGLARLRVSDVPQRAQTHVRASGLISLLGASLFASLAIWWSTAVNRAGLGETFGLVAMAIAAAISGYGFLRGGEADDEASWRRLSALQVPLGMGVAALGALGLGTLIYFVFVKKTGGDHVVELVILMLAGFVLFFSGLYLVLSKGPETDVKAIRFLFLIVGSLLGSLLVGESIFRWFLWKDEIGSTAGMSGDDAWKFWLVAYTFVAGLALFFGSSSLVVSLAKDNAGLRQFLFGYGAVAAAVLGFVVLVVGNVMFSIKDPYTFTWSKSGFSTLSPGSKNLLASLDKEDKKIDAIVIMSPRSPSFGDLKVFLENCQGLTNKLAIEWIDSEQNAKYNSLKTRFPEISGPREMGGVLLVQGALTDDLKTPVPHAWIPDTRLFDKQGDNYVFKAEAEVMKEIDFLAKKRERRKLYFLQGNDELSLAAEAMPRTSPAMSVARSGASMLVEKLKKDNFDVVGVSFGKAPPADPKEPKGANVVYLGSESDKKIDLPADCDTLLVLGASAQIPAAGLAAIDRFMDERGGRMVVMLDVVFDRDFKKMQQSGIEDVLKKFGVIATNEFVFRMPTERDVQVLGQFGFDPRLVLVEVPEKASTPLAKQFMESPMLWTTTRVIRPGISNKYQIEKFLVVSKERDVWTEDNPKVFLDLGRYLQDSARKINAIAAREDIPVALTVSENGGVKPRLAVFGDAEFISNFGMTRIPQPHAYDYVRSSIEWMSERGGYVGPAPKETQVYTYGRNPDMQSMVYGSSWTMMTLILMFGAGVWLVRRR